MSSASPRRPRRRPHAPEPRQSQRKVVEVDAGRKAEHVELDALLDGGRGEDVAARVASDGPLRPQPGAVLAPGPLEEVRGAVAAPQASGIDGRRGLVADQAAVLGARGGLEEEQDELPFFSSRPAA